MTLTLQGNSAYCIKYYNFCVSISMHMWFCMLVVNLWLLKKLSLA